MGIVDGPSPRFVAADIVTFILDDGGHDDIDEISNSPLQVPLSQ